MVSFKSTAGALFVMLSLLAFPSAAQSESGNDGDDLSRVKERLAVSFPLPEHTYKWTFRDLAGDRDLRIDGVANRMTLGFGARLDQIVTEANVNFTFSYSPVLAAEVSQLRITLNDEIVRAIPLRRDQADRQHQHQIRLSPELMANYNELEFELIAEAQGLECAVFSPAAWLQFFGDSTLEITRNQLVVANDLAWFPEPFFDVREFQRLNLAFMFPDEISNEYVQAAAILSSYFGAEADWRGVETKLYRYDQEPMAINYFEDNEFSFEHNFEWPEQHGIIFITNNSRPWLLSDLENVNQPQIRMITNPVHRAYKLLVVQAPSAAGLVTAVQGLTLRPIGLSGPTFDVHSLDVEPRLAYSAPRWISTEEPTQFSDLVDFPSELQRTGYQNAPVSLNMRLPPDLFTWQRQGIPVDLKFRYTPPVQRDESRLRVFVNGEFIKGFTLNESGMEGTSDRIRVPLLGENPFSQSALQIPAFKLGALNQLEFEFSFSALSEECRVQPLGNTLGSIDGDSTIDLRGYSHYTEMPNLHLFVKTGYPFTRYDDLSQTLLVVQEKPTNEEINSILTAFAVMGAASGYPAVLVDIAQVADVPEGLDKDILLVGGNVLREWLQRFGRSSLDKQLQAHGLAGQQQLLFSPDGSTQISGPSAAIVSFESTLKRGRTVVALTANQNGFLPQIAALMRSNERNTAVTGFMTVLTPGNMRHLATYETYYVGELSLWNRLSYHLSRYPFLVAVFTLIALITLVMVMYWFLTGLARRRQGN